MRKDRSFAGLWAFRLLLVVAVPVLGIQPLYAANGEQPAKAKAEADQKQKDVGSELALTLEDAVFIGLRNNTTIRSAYIDRIAQKYDLRVAEDIFTPHASMGVQVTRQIVGGIPMDSTSVAPTVTALSPLGTTFSFTWGNSATDPLGTKALNSGPSFTVMQPLLNGAGTEVNLAPVRAARLGEDINQINLRATISQSITNIILAYRSLLLAQQTQKLSEDSVTRAQALIDSDQALIQAGRMARVEIVQAQADLENQRLSVLQAKGQVEMSRLALAVLLDIDLKTKVVLRETSQIKRTNVALEQAIKIAMIRRPDYLIQKDIFEQVKLGVVVAENQRLWSLNLVASGQYTRQYSYVGKAQQPIAKVADTYVGVQLIIPINDLTRNQPAVHAAGAYQDAEIQLRVIKQGVEQQVRSAALGVDLSWQQLEVARRAATFAASAIDIEKQKLNVGKSSNFQVQALEASNRAAENQKLNSEINYLNALTTFDFQVGSTLDTWKIAIKN